MNPGWGGLWVQAPAKKIPRGEPEGISLTLKTTNMVIMLIPIQPQIRSIAGKGLLYCKKFYAV